MAFLGYGLTIPEYQSKARQKREACEALVGALRQDECWRIYDQDIAAGRATSGNSSRGYEAPIDIKLVEATKEERAAADAQALEDCKKNLPAKKAEYQRLMNNREYWSASLTLRRCSELQDDGSLKSLVAKAEQRQYIMEIEAPATSREFRIRAIEALLRDYPEVGKKYEKQLKR